MKTDQFVKVLMVIIALLLTLNYVTSLSPSSAATPPPFLQQGSFYKFDTRNPVKVIEIDDSGWIKVQDVDAIGQVIKSQFGNSSYWINTHALRSVEAYTPLK
jgi:hypothetical protein